MDADQQGRRGGDGPTSRPRPGPGAPDQGSHSDPDQQGCTVNYHSGPPETTPDEGLAAHERRLILDGRSPHADRLDVAIARIYGRHLGRRAWRRAYPALIAAALIVACDWWPTWLA